MPEIHPNLLWIALPDVVGDPDATLERFREWHMWLSHLGRLEGEHMTGNPGDNFNT